MLGNGEHLRVLTTTVEQLLDHGLQEIRKYCVRVCSLTPVTSLQRLPLSQMTTMLYHRARPSRLLSDNRNIRAVIHRPRYSLSLIV